MNNTAQIEKFKIPGGVNFVSQGRGVPVVMIHGLAASLHDWDLLLPELAGKGYAGYALDLLGHGDSPKPDVRNYRVDWLFDHFLSWLESLHLDQPAVIVGHSLGGYIALQFAQLHPDQTRGLILVDPVYTMGQLPAILRIIYSKPILTGLIIHKTPGWLLRMIIDLSSLSLAHRADGLYELPDKIREQTVRDYARTAPGVYNLLNEPLDLTTSLASITMPVLVVWGDHDRTLKPNSFTKLVKSLPNASGKSIRAGHVPHQSEADWFNGLVVEFLASFCQ